MSFYTHTKNPIGSFVEKDTGNHFEYSLNEGEMVLSPPAHGGRNMEFPHKVWVGSEGVCGDRGYRYAKVGKTVVHIITNEDEFGRSVVEKWHIKNCIKYV